SDDLAAMEIKSTVDNANQAMADVQAVTDKINRGEGSLGLLVNDDQLYNNLNSASAELDELIRDLKTNPGKYLKLSIFGKKDTKKQRVLNLHTKSGIKIARRSRIKIPSAKGIDIIA